MATTGLAVLDRSVQKTHVWLNELTELMGWAPPPGAGERERGAARARAYTGLRAVMHALRDRLTLDEAIHLGAQLPMVLRGMYFEGWNPSVSPRPDRSREEFLTQVAEPLIRGPEIPPEGIARGVFALLARRVTEGEIADVTGILPGPLKELWPAPELPSVAPRARAARTRRRRGAARRKAKPRGPEESDDIPG